MSKQAPKQPQLNNYLKYSGIGLQLVAVCLGLIVIGVQLDKWFNQDQMFTLISIFIAVFAVIYILIKKLK